MGYDVQQPPILYPGQCSLPLEWLIVYIQATTLDVMSQGHVPPGYDVQQPPILYPGQCSLPLEWLIVYIQATTLDVMSQGHVPPVPASVASLANVHVVLSSTAEDGEIEVRISVG
uniref:Uncharacterized protein n=1 Tax=Timema cristinae TaxID=61476 RepID=A0A7R9DGJ5_TIMCR|nr:unnamed protein product [Timema cristinae]